MSFTERRVFFFIPNHAFQTIWCSLYTCANIHKNKSRFISLIYRIKLWNVIWNCHSNYERSDASWIETVYETYRFFVHLKGRVVIIMAEDNIKSVLIKYYLGLCLFVWQTNLPGHVSFLFWIKYYTFLGVKLSLREVGARKCGFVLFWVSVKWYIACLTEASVWLVHRRNHVSFSFSFIDYTFLKEIGKWVFLLFLWACQKLSKP